MKDFVSAQFLYNCLDMQFKPDLVTDVFPKKGLQYHNTDIVRKVYTATFANPTVIDEIIKRGEKEVMLFTHHPKPPMPSIVNGYSELTEEYIKKLKDNKITLFSFHIPLDVFGTYAPGNALGEALGANVFESFYPQNGKDIGALCVCGYDTVYELRDKLAKITGHEAKLYLYGDAKIQDGKFGILAGCAKNPGIYAWLKEHGINTFVTGTAAPIVDWTVKNHAAAKEAGVNIISGTHCSTEKFAPIKMVQYFKNLGVDAEFIDEEPNLEEL